MKQVQEKRHNLNERQIIKNTISERVTQDIVIEPDIESFVPEESFDIDYDDNVDFIEDFEENQESEMNHQLKKVKKQLL